MTLTKENKQKFASLACQLSPENLCCDGELPQYLVRQRYSKLTKQWKALEKQIGMKVTEEQTWEW